jgi:hypothetical protein
VAGQVDGAPPDTRLPHGDDPFMPREVERSQAAPGNPGMYGLNTGLLFGPWGEYQHL